MMYKMINFETGISTRVMKLKEIRDEKGSLAGVFIPAGDITALKQSLKTGSDFHSYFNRIQVDADAQTAETDKSVMDHLSINEVNENSANLTRSIHEEAFLKGEPMFYRDQRAKDPKEFIRANPDGSEDLVIYDIATRSYSVLKSLLPAGQGYWSKLSINK